MPRVLETTTPVFTPAGYLKFAVGSVVLLLGGLILTPYGHYVPPDFGRGFLKNKSDFFFSSGYFLGFYAHIFSAPIALACGTLQMSRSIRTGWPRLHRSLGKVYVALVLLLAAPGGVVMATRAYGGTSSVICFALIGVLAWVFTWIAWRMARSGRYTAHGRWMARSYLMMCSAIMLRLIHYMLQPLCLDAMLTYQLAAWLSWVPALTALEASVGWSRRQATSVL